MEEALRGFRVFGKVQGVFFRHSTRLEAERLSLRGTVCNLADGSVQVVVLGATDVIGQLQAWLAHGPVRARVDRVEEFEPQAALRAKLPDSFEVR
jgi:acylphosphatase